MRLGIIWRVLGSSAVFGLILAYLVERRGEGVAPVSIVTVALFIGAGRVLLRSLAGKSSLVLTRDEMLGIAIPIGIAWLGIGVTDLLRKPASPWVLVAGGAGLVVYGIVSGTLVVLANRKPRE